MTTILYTLATTIIFKHIINTQLLILQNFPHKSEKNWPNSWHFLFLVAWAVRPPPWRRIDPKTLKTYNIILNKISTDTSF